jgi:phosphopantothenoylcysteine decarboxylase/phosphopantothenate--cysteine ligase
MRPFHDKRVLVGVSGGIAAYKTPELVRQLLQAGSEVQVILTSSGARFVGPTTFEGLTGRPVMQSLWDGSLQHIDLGRWADAIVVAPATANLLAKLATGIADDLLTTTLLAAPQRALLAPAMNVRIGVRRAGGRRGGLGADGRARCHLRPRGPSARAGERLAR